MKNVELTLSLSFRCCQSLPLPLPPPLRINTSSGWSWAAFLSSHLVLSFVKVMRQCKPHGGAVLTHATSSPLKLPHLYSPLSVVHGDRLLLVLICQKDLWGWVQRMHNVKCDLSCDLPGLDLKHNKRKEKVLLYDQKSIFPRFMWLQELHLHKCGQMKCGICGIFYIVPCPGVFAHQSNVAQTGRKWAKIISASLFYPQHLF